MCGGKQARFLVRRIIVWTMATTMKTLRFVLEMYVLRLLSYFDDCDCLMIQNTQEQHLQESDPKCVCEPVIEQYPNMEWGRLPSQRLLQRRDIPI